MQVQAAGSRADGGQSLRQADKGSAASEEQLAAQLRSVLRLVPLAGAPKPVLQVELRLESAKH